MLWIVQVKHTVVYFTCLCVRVPVYVCAGVITNMLTGFL